MEITPTKSLIVLGLLAALGLVVSYGWAHLQVGNRFHAFNASAHAIGYARGGRLPTAADVETQVRDFAAANQIELTDVQVLVHDEAGLGRIAERVPQLGVALTGSQRIYDVTGTARSQALFVSRAYPLTIHIALRSSVSVRAPERPMPGRDEADNVRGLRR